MIALALLLAAPAATAQPVAIAQADQPVVEVWQLDQVQIDRDTDPKVLKAIEPAHSIPEVITLLRQNHVAFNRTDAMLLPDRLPDAMRAQILAQPQGEPFVLPEASFISINVIVRRKLPSGAVRWQPPQPTPFTRMREA